jgi:hypothetical protein
MISIDQLGREMITTVTTTTTTVITSAAAASLTLIAIVTFVLLLVQKEIAGGLENERAKYLARALNVVLVPLFLVFLSAFALKVADMWR